MPWLIRGSPKFHRSDKVHSLSDANDIDQLCSCQSGLILLLGLVLFRVVLLRVVFTFLLILAFFLAFLLAIVVICQLIQSLRELFGPAVLWNGIVLLSQEVIVADIAFLYFRLFEPFRGKCFLVLLLLLLVIVLLVLLILHGVFRSQVLLSFSFGFL